MGRSLTGNKGACKYYISTLGGVGGLTRNAYFAYGVRGVGGSEANCLCKRSEL